MSIIIINLKKSENKPIINNIDHKITNHYLVKRAQQILVQFRQDKKIRLQYKVVVQTNRQKVDRQIKKMMKVKQRQRESIINHNNYNNTNVAKDKQQLAMNRMKQSIATTDSLKLQNVISRSSKTPQKRTRVNNKNKQQLYAQNNTQTNTKTTVNNKRSLQKYQLQKQHQKQQQQTMNEIMQMLKMIYVALWNQGQYNTVLTKYQQIEQNGDNDQFSVQGKLLEDIVQGIEQMKALCTRNVQQLGFRNKQNNIDNNRDMKNNNNNNKDTKLLLLNDYYLSHYSNNNSHNFAKKNTMIVDTNDNNKNISKNTITNGHQPKLQQQQQQYKQYKQQLQKKQKKIKKLQLKIQELQQQLQQFKQESVNLHRLNESKYSQISQLKKHIQQQQQCIEQQVSVIEELQKTLNESVMMMGNNNSSIMCVGIGVEGNNRQLNDQKQTLLSENNNVLGGLEEEIMLENHKKQELILKGKQLAWTQMLQQIEQQILRIELQRQRVQQYFQQRDSINKQLTCKATQNNNNNQVNANKSNTLLRKNKTNHIPKQLQQQQFQLTSINMNNLPNHRYNRHYIEDDDDELINVQNNNGIQQIQLSFCDYDNNDNTKNGFDVNNAQNNKNQYGNQYQQQQQISQIYHHKSQYMQIQEQPSLLLNQALQINPNLLYDTNKSNINYLYLQNQMEEYSIISNNPTRYLQTIQTMTQQLTQAYQTINLLQSKINNNNNNDNDNNKFYLNNKTSLNQQYQHPIIQKQKHFIDNNNNNQHYNNTSPNNPQSKNLSNIKNNKQSKKNKSSFRFNLSFWK